MMKKFFKWWLDSNRLEHVAYGLSIGFVSHDEANAVTVSAVAAVGIEIKDKRHGGKFDTVDLALTVGAAWVGFTIKKMLLQ